LRILCRERRFPKIEPISKCFAFLRSAREVGNMAKIVKVEALTYQMAESWLTKTEVACQMSCYPKYKKTRDTWMYPMTTVIVKITADTGQYGYGWAGGGKAAAAVIINEVYSRLLLHEDPFNVEYLWDVMYRASLPFGRKGIAIEALSAVDTALYDLLGKIAELPVYKLIGGKVRDKIKVYATGNALEKHVERSFKDVKLAMPYGPQDGREGMIENEKLVRKARELMGYEGDVMLDCYMSWDEEYTISMAHKLKDYAIRWIEEPLMPEFYDGYRRLKDMLNPMGILVTGGEHEFTHYGFRELIEKNCVNILQPDIGRTGGITAFKKICAMASAYNIPVIPHGSGCVPYHAVISSTVSPIAEYIDVYADGGSPHFIHEPIPVNGFVEVADTPGFGYELNPELSAGVKPVPIW
jgi:L-rhamnonate dehydratase